MPRGRHKLGVAWNGTTGMEGAYLTHTGYPWDTHGDHSSFEIDHRGRACRPGGQGQANRDHTDNDNAPADYSLSLWERARVRGPEVFAPLRQAHHPCPLPKERG